jgi:uncharacterized repeat protein (TIGR01451 family)
MTFAPSKNSAFIVSVPPSSPPPQVLLQLPADSMDIAAGDVNEDGNVDLIGVNSNGQVGIQAGNGAGGTAGSPGGTSVPNGATRIALGDVTGDGKTDIVVAGNQFVAVAPRNSNGGFGPVITSTTTVNVGEFVLADFNGDGKLDVAMVPVNGSDVTVLVNQGNGSFAQPTVIATVSSASDLAVGDFNKDGKPDLVVAKRDANTAVVFLNTTTAQPPAMADAAVQLTAQPITVLLNPCIRYTVSVKNNGPAPLTSATVTATLPFPLAAAAGGQCTPGTGNATCAFGAIASGATDSRSFTIPLHLFSLGTPYTVTAKRTASTPTDSNAANDQASRSCLVVSQLLTLCL